MPQKTGSKSTGQPRLALIVTDVYAFNVLGRGQLEFFRNQGVMLDLYCGGSKEGLAELKRRNLGRVFAIALRREPRPFWDLLALVQLVFFLTVNRYDSVVCSTPKAMLLGSIAGAMGRQKYRVALIRGRAYENYVGFKRWIFVTLDRLALASAHRTVFISHSQHEAFMKDGLSKKILPEDAVPGHGSSNGVDTSRFKPRVPSEKAALRQQVGLSEDSFVIVVVGRIAPDKGTRLALKLMRALRDLPNVVCVFVGNFEDDALRAELEDADDARVRHQPACSNVEDWFALADLNLMPSSREGFGNVAIEAAASGVLTVAFDVVGLRDSVHDGISGHLFTYGDIKAVERQIRSMILRRQDLHAEGETARRWAVEHFDQQTVWSNYLSLFLPRHFG